MRSSGLTGPSEAPHLIHIHSHGRVERHIVVIHPVPPQVPVLALRNLVVFPQTQQLVRVGREKSVRALRKALETHQWIFLVLQKEPQSEIRGPEDLLRTGTLCRIDTVKGNEAEGYQITIRGTEIMDVIEWEESGQELQARLAPRDLKKIIPEDSKPMFLESIKKVYHEARAYQNSFSQSQELSFLNSTDLEQIVFGVAQVMDFDLKKKQKLIESESDQDRVMYLLQLLQDFRDQGKIRKEIQEKLTASLAETQKQHILREQMKVIKNELGDGDQALDELEKRISQKNLPEEARKFALSQLKKLQSTPTQSPDHHILRNHLEFVVDLPWDSHQDKSTNLDLKKAREILDADHFGMEKVKRRILESLAARKLKNKREGSVLLLVGPPGVGKTSLAQSLAKSMDKEYVRVSLGGVRDEAEIRGHRRTYVGALPGRILSGMKKVSRIDPVFVLDEIDKLSRGYSGDPSAALLEVLDPEQNHKFSDHYLETPYDLSQVFFVCTANSLETIPAPLLDRMEVIELGSYSTEEKIEIGKRHLVPQLSKEYGLEEGELHLSEDVLKTLIQRYTREAGVRELKRKIESLLRSLAEEILASREKGEKLTFEVCHLEKYLGPFKFRQEYHERRPMPGLVTGLAWTPVGGEVLTVETALVPGEGKIIITGQLGDVMKESVQIALTHLKARLQGANAVRLTVAGGEAMTSPASKLALLKQFDLHIHIPSGATPKEGPSAGITLLAALASLFLERSVEGPVAMTGEITLRGAVLPVGGIKEKVLAAHRAGIRKVLLPAQNKRDLDEVPVSIRNEMNLCFVETVDDVLRLAFAGDPPLLPSSLGPTSSFQSGPFTE